MSGRKITRFAAYSTSPRGPAMSGYFMCDGERYSERIWASSAVGRAAVISSCDRHFQDNHKYEFAGPRLLVTQDAIVFGIYQTLVSVHFLVLICFR